MFRPEAITMADSYQFPVFFECRGLLSGEDKKKTERFFRVHRRSGGGDCGPLTRAAGDVYSIAFRRREDQQEVLKRSKHVVELTDGCLELSVRGDLPPPSSSYDTTAEESQQTIPDPTDAAGEASDHQCDGPVHSEACDRHLLGQSAHPTEHKDSLGREFESAGQNIVTAGAPKGLVQVEIGQGTIESQKTDAVVSPMVFNNPLSTCVGNILSKAIGSQVTQSVKRKSKSEMGPGDFILEEDLTGPPFGAVFFLNLVRGCRRQWNRSSGSPIWHQPNSDFL
ncbi:uncharacterized protein LOC129355606 [Poeciliopsis prolifica]|uniref:uncharacterized protein LOC129355606 n=1 Tax=Poeciliopsis prolifica TaxID=188132 RepID=UPI002413DB1E|nr:uncharacterized protein LOC129355606 [Poeciliopsis prolifica]